MACRTISLLLHRMTFTDTQTNGRMHRRKPGSIGGSVVECSPATRAARVRFPADAINIFIPQILLPLTFFFESLPNLTRAFLFFFFVSRWVLFSVFVVTWPSSGLLTNQVNRCWLHVRIPTVFTNRDLWGVCTVHCVRIYCLYCLYYTADIPKLCSAKRLERKIK